MDEIALFPPTNFLGPQKTTSMQIVDMNKETQTAPHPLIGYTTSNAIEQTLQEKQQVLCVYNKKGVSRGLKCQDCGQTFPCLNCGGMFIVYENAMRCHRCRHAEPVPLSCPSCHGVNLQQKGFGNRRVGKILANLFSTKVSLIEKGLDCDLHAPILLVTQYFYENIFNPFQPMPIGLVVELNGDLPLYQPTLRAFEHAIINAEAWRGVAHASGGRFILQTQAPDLFEEYLHEPRAVFERELVMRKTYDQPPARRWMRVVHRSDEPRASEIHVQTLMQSLRSHFPDLLLVGPRKNRNDLLEFDLGIKPSEITPLLTIIRKLDDAFVIDTNLLF